ncbi:MAG TPA: hypothetical protein VN698_04320, partial [Bacteroidia bacterium]|nr:hypothetical protein [Bacteroidia bacterium]
CDSWEKTIIDDIIINDVVPDKFVCPKNKNADSCAAARRDFIKSFGYEFNVSFSIKKLGYESSWGVSVRKIKGKVLYAAGCVFNPEPPPANK